MFFDQLSSFAGASPWNLMLLLALLGLTVAIVVNEFKSATRGYKAVSPARLTELINREDALVIDVSPAAEYEKGHIIGSRHVPMSQFDPESKQISKARELPVAVVCRNGITSGTAAKRLVAAGFKQVHALEGGVAAWQQADLPLAKGRDKGRERGEKSDKPGKIAKA